MVIQKDVNRHDSIASRRDEGEAFFVSKGVRERGRQKEIKKREEDGRTKLRLLLSNPEARHNKQRRVPSMISEAGVVQATHNGVGADTPGTAMETGRDDSPFHVLVRLDGEVGGRYLDHPVRFVFRVLRLAASPRTLRYADSQRLASVFLNVTHMDSFSVLYTRYFSARINEVVGCARLWLKAFNVFPEWFRRHVSHVLALDTQGLRRES